MSLTNFFRIARNTMTMCFNKDPGEAEVEVSPGTRQPCLPSPLNHLYSMPLHPPYATGSTSLIIPLRLSYASGSICLIIPLH